MPWTCPFEAAKAGNAHLVSIFLTFRADVNRAAPKTLRTPLHEAMAQGHERAMWALLCARADLQAADIDGQAGRVGQDINGRQEISRDSPS